MFKNKYILLFILLPVIFSAMASTALALEVQYPVLPGLPDLNNTSLNLKIYIQYFFGLGIYLVGALSLISFTIGAIGLINPSIEAHSAAKDRMKGAILGLGLTLLSVIIISTINPQLANITMTPLQPLAGVYLTSGNPNIKVPTDGINYDVTVLPKADDPTTEAIEAETLNSLTYQCAKVCSTGDLVCPTPDSCTCSNSGVMVTVGVPKLVWKFQKPGLEQGNNLTSEVTIEELACDDTISLGTAKSFRIESEVPGVYYYLTTNCSGYASVAQTTSTDSIDNLFDNEKNKVKSVKIVNDRDKGIVYGAIFHNVAGLTKGGICSTPIVNPPGTGDGSIGNPNPCNIVSSATSPSAVDIFLINQNFKTSGDGIAYYSEPYGWASGQNAGYYLVDPFEEIKSDPLYSEEAKDIDLFYVGVDRPQGYQESCETFQDCPGSIKISGSYLVALYSKNSYCQTFTKDVENLKTQPILAAGSGREDLSEIYIVPTTITPTLPEP